MAAFLLTQQFADCLHGLILCQGRISLMDSLLFWPQKHPGGGRHLLPQSLHHLSLTEIAGWAVCSYSPVRKHSADCIQQAALARTLCMMIFMAFFVKLMCVSFVPFSVDMQMLMNQLAMQMAMLMHQIGGQQ